MKPALDLLDEAVEEGGELLMVGMVWRFGDDGHRGLLVASVDQSNRTQVGVLDGPSVALDRGDGHAQAGGVAFPRDDDRADEALTAGELLNGAGDHSRRSGGGECDSYARDGIALA